MADRDGDGPVGAPPVELAGGVHLEQVALLEHPVARDAVDDLLVEAQAGDGRERRLAGVALEQRDGPVIGVELLDRLVDVEGADPGLGHVPADLQGAGDQLAGLPHQGEFPGRLQFRRAEVRVTEHGGAISRQLSVISQRTPRAKN